MELNKQVGGFTARYESIFASVGRVILEFLQVSHNVVCTPSHDSSTQFANIQFHSFRFERFHFIVHKIRGFALFGFVKVAKVAQCERIEVCGNYIR